MAQKPRHTIFAARAFGLAELFQTLFGKHKLDGNGVSYGVDLTAPEGESTAGGKQALQHIRLAPDGGGATVVAGSANTTAKQVEIRTYTHVAAQFAERFKGASFPITKAAYDDLVTKVQGFFGQQGFTVVMMDVRPRAPSPSPSPSSSSSFPPSSDELPAGTGSSRPVALIVGVAVILVGVVAFLALR